MTATLHRFRPLEPTSCARKTSRVRANKNRRDNRFSNVLVLRIGRRLRATRGRLGLALAASSWAGFHCPIRLHKVTRATIEDFSPMSGVLKRNVNKDGVHGNE